MLFNSLHFLLFFPIVVLFYFIIPRKIRWVWLLVASYYFYMSWNPKYALLMALSTLITYLSGLLLEWTNKTQTGAQKVKLRKMWVALSFISNLAILFFFKYFDFTLMNLNFALSFFHIQPLSPAFDVMLPVGISFYTFQALSYTMDVYRGDVYAEHNFFRYALFVSFFPQLVAGPIERSKNLLVQVNVPHTFDIDRVRSGLMLMLWGYFEKVVIADRVAMVVDTVYDNYASYSGLVIVVATLLFAVQIYCDFSGYSGIAIGAAQVLGFSLMENFHRPYFATSIREFWRRWHISLSTWFRDYLYIPLGGSRCSKWRRRFNLMVTFLVSGLWHGASWNFVIWGDLHGAYQIMGDILKPARNKALSILKVDTNTFSHKLLRIITTFVLVDFAWIFFRAPSGMTAFTIVRQMFSSFNPYVFLDGTLFTLGLEKNVFLFTLLCIGILLLVSVLRSRTALREALVRQSLWLRWTVSFIAFFVIVAVAVYDAGITGQQFIYFQF